MSALQNYPILSQVLQSIRADPSGESDFVRTKQAEWHNALEAVSIDHAALDAILAEHRLSRRGSFGAGLKRSSSLSDLELLPRVEQAAILERVEGLMETCRALEAEIEHTRPAPHTSSKPCSKQPLPPARDLERRTPR